jgi:creatinine amidohydrolase/Fe(II)-dependent formamide hydrolase-like protein
MSRVVTSTLVLLILSMSTWTFGQAASPDPDTPRPIDALDTVFIEEMTWMEVRDALKDGKTTVIVATGGIEQNGPYVATGKHNYILLATTEVMARELGNALVAPIIKLVPEGNHEPPSGHMRYPGTISLREETFTAVLEDVCTSFKVHGFRDIVLLGDSGGNQDGMKNVTGKLNANWADGDTRLHYIPEYYDFPGVEKWLETQGIHQVDEGLHDDYGMNATLLTVDPRMVRMDQRIAKELFSINGVELSPVEKTIEMGKKLVAWRTGIAVEAIKKSIAARREGTEKQIQRTANKRESRRP